MRRGEVWTLAGGKDYSGKPRPVALVQGDRFAGFDSIVVCGITTVDDDIPLVRPALHPTSENGLRVRSFFMVDKLAAVPKRTLGRRIGMLAPDDMTRLNRAILILLDLVD